MNPERETRRRAGAASRRRGDPRRFAGWLALGLVACGQAQPESTRDAPPPSEAPPAPQTPDRLPPGALLEGSERVFGLPLPRKLTLDAHFTDWARARGPVPLQDLLDYVKARVVVKHVEMLETRIIFPSVRVKGADDHTLRIELLQLTDGAELLIRDLTQPPSEPGLSEEQRWKKAGMTPDGKLIDPQNLE